MAHEPIASAVSALERRATLHEVRTPNGRVAWRVWPSESPGASPGASPLVLFPGGFGSWRHWYRNIDALAAYFEVHCVEPPGLGDSDAPASSPPDLDELADAVVVGFDEVLGVGAGVALVGFSFGGIVAGRTALRLGQRARALVISGSAALGLPIGTPSVAPVRITDELEPAELDAALRHNLAGFMLSSDAIDETAVFLEYQSFMRSRLNYTAIMRSTALRESLERSNCPAGSLCGENDPFIGEHLEDYAALFQVLRPGAPFEVIDGASHWVMYERPARYVNALVRMLDTLGYPVR